MSTKNLLRNKWDTELIIMKKDEGRKSKLETRTPFSAVCLKWIRNLLPAQKAKTEQGHHATSGLQWFRQIKSDNAVFQRAIFCFLLALRKAIFNEVKQFRNWSSEIKTNNLVASFLLRLKKCSFVNFYFFPFLFVCFLPVHILPHVVLCVSQDSCRVRSVIDWANWRSWLLNSKPTRSHRDELHIKKTLLYQFWSVY